MQLDKVNAIITGGASGLGNAVAHQFVANGGRVTLFDVDEDKGQAAVKELGEAARFQRTDVTNEDEVVANVKAAREATGEITVLVNCAGILGAGRVLGRKGPMPLEKFQSTVMVNLVGSFNVAKTVSEQMQENQPGQDGERGVIINTASVAAWEGQIGQAAYSASKGGVASMTLPMARELSHFGIRVASIAPGVFWTPMVDGMPDDVQESLSASIPFPSRLGQPGEYADTVKFILGNRYVNGTTIRLDGGVRLEPK